MKHSIIGASSCERFWNCAGSVEALKGIESETTIYKAEGSLAHTICELALKGDNFEYLLDTVEVVDDFEITINEQMLDAAFLYRKTIFDDRTELAALLVEEKFELPTIHEIAFGTSDAILLEPFGVLRVYDFKYGRGVIVEIKDNRQLMYYALGAFRKFDKQYSFTEIEIIIIQPRGRHKDGVIRRHRFSVEHLLEHEKELKNVVDAALKKNAKRTPGPHCSKTFCSARGNCPEYNAYMGKATYLDFKKESKYTPPPVMEMSEQTLANILKVSEDVQSWLKEVHKEAQKRIEFGGKIPNYKLVKKVGNRKWISQEEVIRNLYPKYGTRIYATDLLSPTKMEALDKGLKKSGALNAYIERPEKGVALVLKDDMREEIRLDAITEFIK